MSAEKEFNVTIVTQNEEEEEINIPISLDYPTAKRVIEYLVSRAKNQKAATIQLNITDGTETTYSIDACDIIFNASDLWKLGVIPEQYNC